MEELTKKLLEVIKYATDNSISTYKASTECGYGSNYVSNGLAKISERMKKNAFNHSEYDVIMDAYNTYSNVKGGSRQRDRMTKSTNGPVVENPLRLTAKEIDDVRYDAETDDAYDARSTGLSIRGKESFTDRHGIKMKKITGYKYKILIRDEKPLTGELSKEQMDSVYRLYSSMDGAGMALRSVSREFPHLSYRDFKRILRAFNITKASLPVPPHVMEEMTEDEIFSLVMRNKEHSILKRLDDGRQKYYEKRYLESQKEISEIKSDTEWVDKILNTFLDKNKNSLLLNPISSKKNNKTKSGSSKNKKGATGGKPTICIFGDIHYGKKCDNPIYGRGYDKDIAHERIMSIAKHAVEEANRKKSSEIVMICMGDIIESAIEDGMHPGHYLEMDLLQHEQVMFAISSMKEMIEYVVNNTDVKVTFCAIHGNHDRIAPGRDEDKNRTAGKIITGVLSKFLSSNRLEFISPKNNLLKLIKGGICIFAQHGDSPLSKKRPVELVNLWGEGNSYYHLLLKGHWHSLKTEEGSNFTAIQAPSVTSTDKYILDDLGNNTLPGFILGSEPENCYGFDYKKVTLY